MTSRRGVSTSRQSTVRLSMLRAIGVAAHEQGFGRSRGGGEEREREKEKKGRESARREALRETRCRSGDTAHKYMYEALQATVAPFVHPLSFLLAFDSPYCLGLCGVTMLKTLENSTTFPDPGENGRGYTIDEAYYIVSGLSWGEWEAAD